MRNHRFLFLFSLAFLLVLSACGGSSSESTEASNEEKSEEQNKETKQTNWEKVQEQGEIVVGTSGTLYATSFHPEDSDQLSGYDVEVMREVAKKLGVEVKFQEIGIDGLFSAVKSGRIDAAINDIEITEKRKDTYSFSEPYKYSYTTMIVREEDLSGIETLEDLEGKKAGGGATTVFSDIARHFGAEVVTYGNATNDVYLRDVDNGRTDAVINDYYLQSIALKAMPQFDLVLHPDIRFHPTEQGILLGKEDQTLQKKINEALVELREDGTLTKISKEFFVGKDASKKPDKEIREIEGVDF
ncbi:transporter substrate-binding domain-containing protein [Pontibacillus yanchengensis]|uniref:Transporter substrate-binding domain-containing protein n=1 Tax=Pontibacillus yanchengensis TaxID=462910 RepID=A0A6I4ZTX3_9BACI|nr:transporter substrate-binding domain-containing protein [Pontibacillus yanchengensis]MYL33685.1 transporter substrate-binding domain-containing protein [Pontibacillus yanchengensis]